MLNKLAKQIADWRAKKGFRTDWGNMPEKLMLVVSELSEAMEAYRRIEAKYNIYATKLRKRGSGIHRSSDVDNFCEELADAIIRILDITGTMGIDIEAEIKRKMKLNNMRPVKHGKQC